MAGDTGYAHGGRPERSHREWEGERTDTGVGSPAGEEIRSDSRRNQTAPWGEDGADSGSVVIG